MKIVWATLFSLFFCLHGNSSYASSENDSDIGYTRNVRANADDVILLAGSVTYPHQQPGATIYPSSYDCCCRRTHASGEVWLAWEPKPTCPIAITENTQKNKPLGLPGDKWILRGGGCVGASQCAPKPR